MKTLVRKLLTAAACAAAIATITPEADATLVTLDGTGYYQAGGSIRYMAKGARQTGRYLNLGADYYQEAAYSMRWITNRAARRSGSLSFEFWAMPYYGATKGIVLMTRGIDPMPGGTSIVNKRFRGSAIFLDEYRFPELNLWEYNGRDWKWRDALSFKRDNLL